MLGKEVAGRLEANNALTFLLIKSRKQQGFTLIELSIVLIIIGLIVGGIMVGQNLIHAAKLRSQIKQIQDLETAINTFQIKYNCLPGDCPNATQFFNDPLVVNGNGDKIILDSASGYYPSDSLSANYGQGEGAEEVAQLFLQLYDAGLSPYYNDGTTGTMPNMIVNPSSGFLVTSLSSLYTASNFKIGNGILLGLAPTAAQIGGNGRIYYRIIGTGWLGSNNNAIQITDIQAIDLKIDDGNPNTGQFGVTFGCIALTNSYTPTANTCNGGTQLSTVAIAGKLLGY